MKTARLTFLLLILPIAALAGTWKPLGIPVNGAYPYKDPFLATMSFALLKPISGTGASGEVAYTRAGTRFKDAAHAARLPYFAILQKHPAPMVFVIPGLASDPGDPTTRYYCELIFSMGFHVVAVPSTMSPVFPRSISYSGVAGDTRNDARDLLAGLQAVSQRLEKRGVKASQYSIFGLSLGALTAGFIADEDQAHGKFAFASVLLLNPPVDVLYGLRQLDRMAALGQTHFAGLDRLGTLLKGANEQSYLAKAGNSGTPGYFLGLGQNVEMSTAQMQYLIGYAYQKALGKLIETGRGGNEDMSFEQYVTTVLKTSEEQQSGRRESLNALNKRNSLTALAQFLKQNQNVHVIHSSDDFLLRPSDMNWLKSTLGNRTKIYPYGGHLGSSWTAETQSQMKTWLTPTNPGSTN